jgi:hypothetical protein
VELRRRWHDPIAVTGAWLNKVLNLRDILSINT